MKTGFDQKLYDRETDYTESQNLAGDETTSTILNQFRNSLGQVSLRESPANR